MDAAFCLFISAEGLLLPLLLELDAVQVGKDAVLFEQFGVAVHHRLQRASR